MENKRFAWWPVTVTSGKRVWLNPFYEHKSLYDATTGRPPLNGLYFIWTETEKEKVIRLLKESAAHSRNVWNDPKLIKEDNLWHTVTK